MKPSQAFKYVVIDTDDDFVWFFKTEEEALNHVSDYASNTYECFELHIRKRGGIQLFLEEEYDADMYGVVSEEDAEFSIQTVQIGTFRREMVDDPTSKTIYVLSESNEFEFVCSIEEEFDTLEEAVKTLESWEDISDLSIFEMRRVKKYGDLKIVYKET